MAQPVMAKVEVTEPMKLGKLGEFQSYAYRINFLFDSSAHDINNFGQIVGDGDDPIHT